MCLWPLGGAIRRGKGSPVLLKEDRLAMKLVGEKGDGRH
jgi:hypothetical protein